MTLQKNNVLIVDTFQQVLGSRSRATLLLFSVSASNHGVEIDNLLMHGIRPRKIYHANGQKKLVKAPIKSNIARLGVNLRTRVD